MGSLLFVLCSCYAFSAFSIVNKSSPLSSQKSLQEVNIDDSRVTFLDALRALFLATQLRPSRLFNIRYETSHRRHSASHILASAKADLPPPFPESEGYSVGSLKDSTGWWRQNSKLFQIVCQIADDVSFKKDVNVALGIGGKDIKVEISSASIVSGQLPYGIVADDSDWFVEDELQGFPDHSRYLVLELHKKEPFVDWPGPVVDASDVVEEKLPPRKRLVIGGSYDAQKQCLAQQKATFQTLRKLPGTTLADVYARKAGADTENDISWYFIGKVAGDHSIDPAASLAAQEVLVKQHARLYLPFIFKACADEDIVVGLAEGNSEMLMVDQPDIPLRRWNGLPADMEMPEAASVGFDYEYNDGKTPGPFSIRRDENGFPTGELPDDMAKFDIGKISTNMDMENFDIANVDKEILEILKGSSDKKMSEILKGRSGTSISSDSATRDVGLFPPPDE